MRVESNNNLNPLQLEYFTLANQTFDHVITSRAFLPSLGVRCLSLVNWPLHYFLCTSVILSPDHPVVNSLCFIPSLFCHSSLPPAIMRVCLANRRPTVNLKTWKSSLISSSLSASSMVNQHILQILSPPCLLTCSLPYSYQCHNLANTDSSERSCNHLLISLCLLTESIVSSDHSLQNISSNLFRIQFWPDHFSAGGKKKKQLNNPHYPQKVGLPRWFSGKESTCNAGNSGGVGSILGSGRSSGGDHGNPFQYSCQENLIDRGAWWSMGSQRFGHNSSDWAHNAPTESVQLCCWHTKPSKIGPVYLSHICFYLSAHTLKLKATKKNPSKCMQFSVLYVLFS